jgi:hypothetical protein
MRGEVSKCADMPMCECADEEIAGVPLCRSADLLICRLLKHLKLYKALNTS